MSMKIISGGQTGVDRAALDTAISLGFEYGGSIPKGRKAEDGPIDERYDKLTELDSDNYKVRTEKNVLDADATIVFTSGKPTGGTDYTLKCLKKHKKEYLLIDIKDKTDDEIIATIIHWLSLNKPGVLNIAGPRESKCPGIYRRVSSILKEVLNAL